MRRFLSFTFLVLSFSFSLGHAKLINKAAPEFNLKTASGKMVKLSDLKNETVVLEWMSHECPFVQKHYNKKFSNMQKLQENWTKKGIKWYSIISSAPGKSGHRTPAAALKEAQEKGSKATEILIDELGTVGKAYGAKTTPHMFVIQKGKVVYEGAIDSVRSADAGDIKKSKNYVAMALTKLEANQSPDPAYTDSYGCSVKYKI